MSAAEPNSIAARVVEWTRAWNACDPGPLRALAHPELRFHRMNGDVVGIDGVEEMVRKQTYGVALKVHPRKLFGRGERYVLGVHSEFRYVENDELAGSSDDGAMELELRDDALVRVAPHAKLAGALEAAGLTEDDWIADLDG